MALTDFLDPISTAASFGSSLFGIIKGANQISEGKQIAKNNPFRPEEMPAEVTQATQLAQQNFTNGMPGMAEAKNEIGRGAATAYATATKGASSGGDLLDAANKEQYNSDIAHQKLTMQAAQYKTNALGGYQSALNTQAGWQDKLYQNNTLQPYLRAASTAASLEGAGNINEAQGIDSAGTAIQAADKNAQNSQLQKTLLGGGGAPGLNPSFTTGGLNTDQIMALSALYRSAA